MIFFFSGIKKRNTGMCVTRIVEKYSTSLPFYDKILSPEFQTFLYSVLVLEAQERHAITALKKKKIDRKSVV